MRSLVELKNADLLTVRQAASRLPGGVTPSGIRKWIAFGVGGRRLPAVKIGGKILVLASDLQDFLEALNDDDGTN
jgi:excisionase family DNA binding protein